MSKPERARYKQVRAFDTNNEWIQKMAGGTYSPYPFLRLVAASVIWSTMGDVIIHIMLITGQEYDNLEDVVSSVTLSSAEASLYRREGWREGKRKRAGDDGKGKETKRLFPPPIAPCALSIFRFLLFSLGYPFPPSQAAEVHFFYWSASIFFIDHEYCYILIYWLCSNITSLIHPFHKTSSKPQKVAIKRK